MVNIRPPIISIMHAVHVLSDLTDGQVVGNPVGKTIQLAKRARLHRIECQRKNFLGPTIQNGEVILRGTRSVKGESGQKLFCLPRTARLLGPWEKDRDFAVKP